MPITKRVPDPDNPGKFIIKTIDEPGDIPGVDVRPKSTVKVADQAMQAAGTGRMSSDTAVRKLYGTGNWDTPQGERDRAHNVLGHGTATSQMQQELERRLDERDMQLARKGKYEGRKLDPYGKPYK